MNFKLQFIHITLSLHQRISYGQARGTQKKAKTRQSLSPGGPIKMVYLSGSSPAGLSAGGEAGKAFPRAILFS